MHLVENCMKKRRYNWFYRRIWGTALFEWDGQTKGNRKWHELSTYFCDQHQPKLLPYLPHTKQTQTEST